MIIKLRSQELSYSYNETKLENMTGLSSSCGACKFLRRRCNDECVFAPYFCYEQAATHFAAVHKVFGASNVSKLLLHLPAHSRSDAATTISYEALARVHDPIYGCVAHIFALQQQVASLEDEIEVIASQLVADLGVDVAISTAPYETSYLYFPTESNITSNYSTQVSARSTLRKCIRKSSLAQHHGVAASWNRGRHLSMSLQFKYCSRYATSTSKPRRLSPRRTDQPRL
ncbi:UNVERIFIED_CONTAM: LOB domain-containing protein 33 [Sesamum angustifolium]|uniref:LOB domain-containing protein 33 n=1 Tax=Sesamum angustifolium TaxID=2727405 RepID=A0AAW2J442_9LAMI